MDNPKIIASYFTLLLGDILKSLPMKSRKGLWTRLYSSSCNAVFLEEITLITYLVWKSAVLWIELKERNLVVAFETYWNHVEDKLFYRNNRPQFKWFIKRLTSSVCLVLFHEVNWKRARYCQKVLEHSYIRQSKTHWNSWETRPDQTRCTTFLRITFVLSSCIRVITLKCSWKSKR